MPASANSTPSTLSTGSTSTIAQQQTQHVRILVDLVELTGEPELRKLGKRDPLLVRHRINNRCTTIVPNGDQLPNRERFANTMRAVLGLAVGPHDTARPAHDSDPDGTNTRRPTASTSPVA